MKEDQLKDTFNSAFDAEQIPFDMTDWNTVEAMLDQKRKRRAAYYWLTGLAALIAGISYLLWPSADAIYTPRLNGANSFTVIEDAVHSKSSEASFTGSERVSPDGATNASAKGAHSSDPSESLITHSSLRVDDLPDMKMNRPTQEEGSSTDGGSDGVALTSASENDLPSTSAALTTRTDLEPMSVLPLESAYTTPDLNDRTLEQPKEQRSWEPYARLGLLYRPLDGLGQVAGIGLTRQVGNHILISGELNLLRDQVSYSSKQFSTVYGFEKYQRALAVRATEVLSAQVPIVVRARFNRFTIGTGVAFNYTIASRVVEEETTAKTTEDFRERIPISNEVGYVRWDAVRPFGSEFIGDAQYQLSSAHFIGSRVGVSLQDAFHSNDRTDRYYRFELYLKLLLQP